MSAGPVEAEPARAPAQREIGDPERDEGERALDQEPAADVAVQLMRELVREHRLDLRPR